MKWMTSRLVILAALALLAGSARAGMVFEADLDGTQEVPPNVSPGYGTAIVTLDGDMISVTLTWNSLLAGATAADIHTAPAGSNGPTVFSLALGNGAGTTDGSIDPTPQTFAITAAQVTDLMNGNDYVNVHTSLFPAGEIRGQLVLASVPEPSSLTLAGSGILFALLGYGWRRPARSGQ
jgi:hypothetical protein